MTAQVWPFQPIKKLTEIREWRTDLLRAKSAEQRIALRREARRIFALDHRLDAQQYSSAQEIIRRFEDFLVPDWTQIVRVDVSPGSQVFIPFDADCYDSSAYDQAILWQGPGAFEVIDLIDMSSSDSGITAIVSGTWTNVRLMPLLPAIAPDGFTAQRLTKQHASGSIRFDITNNPHDPATAYPQYRGHDVMTDCPKLAGGLQESLAWPIELVDNETGLFYGLRDRIVPDATFTLRWRVFGLCAIRALRRWFDSRIGRQKAFWISSRGRDFELAQAIVAASLTIKILQLPGVLPLARNDFDIEIVTTAGIEIRRRVVSWVLSVGNTITLTLDAAVGVNIAVAAIRRISNLRCVRLNADRVEFVHQAAAGCEAAVTCIEVAVPA